MCLSPLPQLSSDSPILKYAYSGYRILYCKPCQSIVFPATVRRHLHGLHSGLPVRIRQQIASCYEADTDDLISKTTHDALPLPPNNSPPVPFLPMQTGFACSYTTSCNFLTSSYSKMRSHLNQEHALYRANCRSYMLPVYLQSWYSSRRAKYWIAQSQEGEGKGGRAWQPLLDRRGKKGEGAGTEKANASRASQLSTLQSLYEQEQAYLVQTRQDPGVGKAITSQEASSNTTAWLDYTEWPVQFANRPLQILVTTASLPAQNDYTLGTWKNICLTSPKDDELKLCYLLDAFDRVAQRCYSTLQTTPELLRCWLKTFTLTGFYPKPFRQLARLVSLRKYQRYWRQFLCFVFRTWQIRRSIRDQIYGIQFSETQEALIQQVWELLEDGDSQVPRAKRAGEEEEEELWDSELEDRSEDDLEDDLEDDSEDESDRESTRDPDAEGREDSDEEWRENLQDRFKRSRESEKGLAGQDALAERLFQLSCAFWTDISTTSITSSLPLVYFSGILGIQPKGLAFRTPYLYTPILAGLVYIGRLLMLEYALPQSAYKTLGWPDCSVCPDQLERLQLIRRKYLCRGSAHPMSRPLELLWQGRSITKKEGTRANISWSTDSQVLTLRSHSTQYQVSLSQIRTMVWITVQDCQTMLQQLMFDWQPAVDLKRIRDSLVNSQPGWSFLTEPSNQLSDSYRQLSERAWMSKGGLRVGEKWSRSRSENYLQQAMKFSRLLQVCLHFVGGMPGRTTEFAAIKYQNTQQVMRNIFVHNGRLAIITEYHKARSRTNHAFYIVRILPRHYELYALPVPGLYSTLYPVFSLLRNDFHYPLTISLPLFWLAN